MTRIPKSKTTLKRRRDQERVFQAAPGSRMLAGALCIVLAIMFAIHQTQVDGAKPLIRLFALSCTVGFSLLAWYLIRRGRRRGITLRVGKDGFGIALGFDGWLDVPWDAVKAFHYWEPTGTAMLIKRRQARWVGITLKDRALLATLPRDQMADIRLNRFHGRPDLCILHPYVEENILEVLEAFQDHAKHLDDPDGLFR